MNNLNLTAEQAMTALGIPQEKRSMFLEKINQEDAENQVINGYVLARARRKVWSGYFVLCTFSEKLHINK